MRMKKAERASLFDATVKNLLKATGAVGVEKELIGDRIAWALKYYPNYKLSFLCWLSDRIVKRLK